MNGEHPRDPNFESFLKKAEEFVLGLQNEGIEVVKFDLHREQPGHRWAVRVTVRRENFFQVMEERG